MKKSLYRQAVILFVAMIFIAGKITAQFTPVAVSGFNHDCVAETGTSSLTTTTIPLDGVTQSNKVMYTNTFRIANGFGGGGIPDNGTIINGADSYQLAPYNGNNVLLLQRNQNADLNIVTPSKFRTIRILCFSTEGTSLVNATLFFSDGSSATALTNYSLGDWFNGNTNLVLSGIGRCTRATPATGADGFPTNPRMYYIEINLSCANQQKNLQRINFANVTTAGNNAPYPNAVFLALSARTYSQNISSAITNATCAGNNGSATLTVTGSTSPYTYSWNTTPLQTGATAINLNPGNYQCTITDANGCTSFYPVTVGLQNTLTMNASKTDASCSAGGTITVTASGGSGYEYSMNGGTGWQASNVFNNVPAGTYNVVVRMTALNGCTASQQVTIGFTNNLTMSAGTQANICFGASFTPSFNSNATSFSWSPSAGVSNTGIINPVLTPQSSTNYTVTATLGSCILQRTVAITVFPGATVNAGPDATIIAGDVYQMQAGGTAGSYLWSPSVSLSLATVLNPTASPASTTTYTLQVTTGQGCTATDDVTITVVPYCVKPMEAFSPNGDGINDLWLITNGNCLTSAKAQVFNRYGSKVFEDNNYKNNWNGTYKGKPLPDGTYYYIISFRLINGRVVLLKGNLTILR
jgi:gliding motility-associated-like protein